MEILTDGKVKTEKQLEALADFAIATGLDIVFPGRDDEADDAVTYFAIIRDTDGAKRLYVGTEVTFGRYVAASEGVN